MNSSAEKVWAVDVSHISKSYKLYDSARARLKEAFHPFKKAFHQEFFALQDVSLQVPKGSTIGIIGKNGSGKSTLLQTICGIISPTSGTIEVKGRIAALLELGAGFNPEFSGRDNLYINASILGLTDEEIDARLDDILAFADIGEFIDQPVRSYSSGMYVRLAFAIAIHVDPDILIIDEALAVGDVQFQAKCYERFHRFRKQGVTVIFVTHDLNIVTKYCDTAFLLDNGQLVSSGAPNQVVSDFQKLITRALLESKQNDQSGQVNEAIQSTHNPYEQRYGNHKAEIVEAGIYDSNETTTQLLQSGQPYTFRLTIHFHEQLINPVFAYTIKDPTGTVITGTNTRYMEIETGVFEKGEVASIEFKQTLFITAGSFLISFGCVGFNQDDIEVYDRRHDYMDFQILSEQTVMGMVDLQSEIKISKTQS